MSNKIKMPSELDEGSIYVYVHKLEQRMEQIENKFDSLTRKLEILTEKAKEAVSKSEVSMTTATRAIKTRSLAAKNRIKKNVSSTERKWPAYPLWLDYLKKIYAPVNRYEFNQLWLKREVVYNYDVRRELALKFGQQMLDDNFIGQNSVTRMMSMLGFKVSVSRLMPNLEMGGTIHIDGAIMCRRLRPEEIKD